MSAPVEIACYPWGGEYRPKAFAAAQEGKESVTFFLWTEEACPEPEYCRPNDPVYLDSCLEVFVSCFPTDNRYLNFEMNANGALLLQFGKNRTERKFLSPQDYWENYPQVTVKQNTEWWGVQLKIPFVFLQKVYETSFAVKPKMFRGNFYKCGAKPHKEHYACWNWIKSDVPDFHRPDFFKNLDRIWIY